MMPRFRAWDNWRKRMSVVDRIYIDTKGVRLYDDFGEYWRNFRDSELMQSTRLKDKNGKEIFEGDILRVSDEHSWLEVVSYNQEKAMFVTEEINREFKVPETPLYDLFSQIFLNLKSLATSTKTRNFWRRKNETRKK